MNENELSEEDLRIALELNRQIRGLEELLCGCEVDPATKHPNGSWIAGWASTSYEVCSAHLWLCGHALVWRNRNGDVLTRKEWLDNWEGPYLIGSNFQKIYQNGYCSPYDHISATTEVKFYEDVVHFNGDYSNL